MRVDVVCSGVHAQSSTNVMNAFEKGEMPAIRMSFDVLAK
jgi:hypothetical protein